MYDVYRKAGRTRRPGRRLALVAVALVVMIGSTCQYAVSGDHFVSPQAEALYAAAAHGHLDKARQLMAAGVDINAMNDKEQNLLEIAMIRHDHKAFTNLLELGADPGARGNARNAAIHVAATLDDTWWLKTMLKHGASTEARDALGQTPLFRSLLGNNSDATDLLLEAGADIHARDEKGRTLLIQASEINDFPDVLRFLKLGVNPRATDAWGYTFQYGFFDTPKAMLDEQAKTVRKKVRQWLRDHNIPISEQRVPESQRR